MSEPTKEDHDIVQECRRTYESGGEKGSAVIVGYEAMVQVVADLRAHVTDDAERMRRLRDLLDSAAGSADPMTLSDFRHWSRTAACIFANDGPVAHITRDHAAKIRPFDLALSDLYLRAAEANEAIRAHLAEYQAAGSPGPSPATRCEPEESGDT